MITRARAGVRLEQRVIGDVQHDERCRDLDGARLAADECRGAPPETGGRGRSCNCGLGGAAWPWVRPYGAPRRGRSGSPAFSLLAPLEGRYVPRLARDRTQRQVANPPLRGRSSLHRLRLVLGPKSNCGSARGGALCPRSTSSPPLKGVLDRCPTFAVSPPRSSSPRSPPRPLPSRRPRPRPPTVPRIPRSGSSSARRLDDFRERGVRRRLRLRPQLPRGLSPPRLRHPRAGWTYDVKKNGEGTTSRVELRLQGDGHRQDRRLPRRVRQDQDRLVNEHLFEWKARDAGLLSFASLPRSAG